jgi:hypothetical protein
LRSELNDTDGELWLDALRVVDQSVRDHSSLRHRDRSYLSFVLAVFATEAGESDSDYEIIEGRVSRAEPPKLL